MRTEGGVPRGSTDQRRKDSPLLLLSTVAGVFLHAGRSEPPLHATGRSNRLADFCTQEGLQTWLIWLLHNLVEASFDLFRYLLLGDQLKPLDLHPLVRVQIFTARD